MISLQFSTGGSLDVGAGLIRAFQHGWCPYSHVDIVVPEGLLGARLCGGVKVRPVGYAPFKQVVQVDVPCTSEQAARFQALARAEIGKPYDWRAIAAMAVPRFVVATFDFRRDWTAQDAWFCSEFVVAMLWRAGIIDQLPTEAAKLTPADNYLIVSALRDRRVTLLAA